MEETPELAPKLIIPQTQSLLYGFNGKRHIPPAQLSSQSVSIYSMSSRSSAFWTSHLPTMPSSGGHGSTWWERSHPPIISHWSTSHHSEWLI